MTLLSSSKSDRPQLDKTDRPRQFEKKVPLVSPHTASDCDKNSVWAKFSRTVPDRKQHYADRHNLDVVISFGNRIKSSKRRYLSKMDKRRVQKIVRKENKIDKQRALVRDENYVTPIHKAEVPDGNIPMLENDKIDDANQNL